MSRGLVRAARAATLVVAALVAAPAAGADPAAPSVDLDHGTLTIKGDAAAEALALRAQPGPRRLEVDLGDDDTADFAVGDVEEIDQVDFGGADTIRVGDLGRAAVDQLSVNLQPGPGGPAGDGAPDRILATGTDGDDALAVTGANGTVAIAGLAYAFGITHAEAIDTLAIDTLAGHDAVDASGLAADTIQLTTD